MKLQRRHAKRGRVEIIPMIDTILILLIFYMSFSSFKQTENRIDASMPLLSKVAATAVTKQPLDFTIKVFDKDKIIVNNGATPFDLNTLRDAMMTLASIGQEATVIIEGNPDTEYAAVIGALDACAQAQLKKVAFRPLPSDAEAATP
jgi:biopolymer transport protein ExbD